MYWSRFTVCRKVVMSSWPNRLALCFSSSVGEGGEGGREKR